MYKIRLDDNSYFIVDEDYEITIFWLCFKKTVTIKDYLQNQKLHKYYMKDCINGKIYKREFLVEPFDNKNQLPINKRLKDSQDVQVGDCVIDPEGNPNIVSELHRGEDKMYQLEIDGETFVVNGGHILALVNKETGEKLDISVELYLQMSDEFKSYYVMEKI